MAHHSLIPPRALWLGLISLSAEAQDPTPGAATVTHFPPVEVVDTSLEYRQFEKVEITGSSILAKETKEALPVQVITQREIERSGKTNLSELLQQLPVMHNYAENGKVADNNGGPQSAAIHGYASGTLVLLNGRRLPYYGSNTIGGERAFVDLNILPLSAIERVDILTDGASPRYGSDAVAGVINIITKASVKGTTISAQSTRPAGGKGSGEQANLSWGVGQTHIDGYALQAHLSLEKQAPLAAGDRIASREAAHALDIQGQQLWSLGSNITPHGWPANVQTAQGALVHPSLTQTGACPAQWYALSNGQTTHCYRNAQTALSLYPGIEKKQLFVSGEVQVNSNWHAFGQLLLGEYVQSFVSKDSAPLSLPLNDGGYALFTTQALGPYMQSYTNKSSQATVGLRGQVSDWDVVGAISSGEHRVIREYTGGVVGSTSLQALLNSGLTLEELSQTYPQLSAETWAKFSPYVQHQNLLLDDGNTHLNALDLLASRELANTDNGPMFLGLGLNWRQESIAFMANPLFNSTKSPNFDAQRSNMAVHVELQAPVSENHEINASLREDYYSDFGPVQTGKLGWRWRPVPQFMVRGSVGNGFRAPTLAQLLPLSTDLPKVSDPVSGHDITVKYFGNPELRPERSVQSSVGFLWNPSAHWSLGADLWQLHIRDSFGVPSADLLLCDPVLREQYLVNGSNGTYVKSINMNLGGASARGIDYDAQWRLPTDAGRIRVTIKGTLNLQAKTQVDPNGPYQSNLGQYIAAANAVTPRHQWVMSVGLEKSDWGVMTALNYRSGNTETAKLLDFVTRQYAYVPRKVPGFWTLDVATRWQVSRQLTLSGHIVNLTKQIPPLRLQGAGILNGVDTRYADYDGRTLKVKAEYRF
jgi:iron complex outermembrane recepter protein